MKDLSWLRKLPGKPTVVAEIKHRSPFGWSNPLGLGDQLDICEEYGDIISVHTDEMWGGSWEHLSRVRRMTKKPILAKGFHPTVAHVKEALNRGADWVLTVGWWPGNHAGFAELGEYCWEEIETRNQLLNSYSHRIVLNARNPRTGGDCRYDVDIKPESVIGSIDSMCYQPGVMHRWICQASRIRGPEDVVSGVDAILIGEGLYS